MAAYNSYGQPSPYGYYPQEPMTAENDYGYSLGYTGYQDPSSVPGTYGGSPAPVESSSSSQVYNYSYEAYPGYYQGYNYDSAGVEGQAASAAGMQGYYESQSTKPDSYLNNGSG